MQRAFINALYDIIEKNDNVYYLYADNGTDYDMYITRDMPNRCFNAGISEQNMIGVASGMASMGKNVFVSSNGPFLAYRAHEFIRNDMALQKRNVKVAAFGSGLSVSRLGPTHHASEDIAALRAIPDLLILSPCCPFEAAKTAEFAAEYNGAVYLRLGMSGEKELYGQDNKYDKFYPGECPVLRQGKDTAVFSTGSIASEALKAADILQKDGLDTACINVHTLSPVDGYADLLEKIKQYKTVFSLEEHSVYAGLGSIIAQLISENGLDVKLVPIGLKGNFAKGYGSYDQIRENNGIDAESVANIIRKEYKL